MSYYKKSKFIITNHAVDRAKKRMNMKNESDFMVKIKIKEIIEYSYAEFSNNDIYYYQVPNQSDYYFVVKMKNDNEYIVMTITKMSYDKKINSI